MIFSELPVAAENANVGTASLDWIAVAALIVAVIALSISIWTFIVRDMCRGSVRIWCPDQKSGLPGDAGEPFAEIINRSAFDIRVSGLFAKPVGGKKYDLTYYWGDSDQLPLTIGPRRSEKVSLERDCLSDLVGRDFKVFCETDTGERFNLERASKSSLKAYIESEVANQKAMQDDLRSQLEEKASETRD